MRNALSARRRPAGIEAGSSGRRAGRGPWFGLALALALAGCATPASEQTAQRYAAECQRAGKAGELHEAQRACGRALDSVRQTGLGAAADARLAYALGTVELQLARGAEGAYDAQWLQAAAGHFAQALDAQGKVRPADPRATTKIRLSLAISLGLQGQWMEGARLLEAALPEVHSLQRDERGPAVNILKQFAGQMRSRGQGRLAGEFGRAAQRLSWDLVRPVGRVAPMGKPIPPAAG